MNYDYSKETPKEIERINCVEKLIPKGYRTALDIGCRNGKITRIIADYFESVTALELEKPDFSFPKITPVKGDATHLEFPNNSFDVVFCLEVLEHIPPHLLEKACDEISRVAKHRVVIGVPYKQDIRIGQSTCQKCGTINPPWGHSNSFDETKLKNLFASLTLSIVEYLGQKKTETLPLAVWLQNIAGNPYGVYEQQSEPCIKCGAKLVRPESLNLFQKVCGKVGNIIQNQISYFSKPAPNWIHVVFEK